VKALALVVPFEGLAPVVDDLRERTCISKPSHGMPPHMTLLSPSPRDVEAIAEVLLALAAFEEAVSMVETLLPLRSRAERAVVLEQAQPEHWLEVASFDLEDK
jgi:hypothetical protein